jgi:EAL domain-containing protein (putative c-di-GMP-specific phosphodiesterase class I)
MPQTDLPHDVEVLLRELNQDFMGWDDPPRRLSRALERNEFVLYAQPIMALRDGQNFPMAEVLLRLQEDEADFLPPGGFLPLFEHFQMSPQLDLWVARQSVARLARKPRVPCLCINLSSQTLSDQAFVPGLQSELERAKVPPRALVVELSEHDVLDRPDLVGAFMAALRAVGCRIAISGFGRRSVSLSALTTMRPDFVKVDGGIVRSLRAGQSSQKKLNAMVGTAKALGFELIGEGVEVAETLAQLREAGVDYAQGFGIQVPAPISLIIEH